MSGSQSGCEDSPTSVVRATLAVPIPLNPGVAVSRWQHLHHAHASLQLADYQAPLPSVLDCLPPADVQDRQIFKQQLEAQKVMLEQAPC